jgi:CubicO group peptidase (beta-lactamase class C family)
MRKYFPLTCLIVYFLAFSIVVSAQPDSIDVFVKAQMQRRNIPGLQLAIIQHGRIVKTGDYGFANVQDSVPVNHKTVFPINSITKAFAGVAIMQLAEAGKLTLSSPISAYLSDLPKEWNAVTVLQLLSHTSGVPNIVDEEESVIIANNEENAWKKVVTLPMDFSPGENSITTKQIICYWVALSIH